MYFGQLLSVMLCDCSHIIDWQRLCIVKQHRELPFDEDKHADQQLCLVPRLEP